jgi:hypothetical protein
LATEQHIFTEDLAEGILQMVDNAAAEKSAAAKYGHASARHVTKGSCHLR